MLSLLRKAEVVDYLHSVLKIHYSKYTIYKIYVHSNTTKQNS